ncbi:MAG TPA: class I SAM-dependent methyltransferase [Spirochaetales bacterium]|nr:class I SAM-dependent methyltransferase [Spirochaetales bacterium]
MDIDSLIACAKRPEPYEAGTALMWTDPYISKRLLACHLDPDTDLASRRAVKIDLTVDWILSQAGREGMDILDLGCGPGLYAERLAARGHRVTGVDFSRTSIDYAEGVARKSRSGVEYRCGDYLNLDYRDRFDLAIMIYLDFCVLKPAERAALLARVAAALRRGGRFVFDVVNGVDIEAKVLRPSWELASGGFWREGPCLALGDGLHYPEIKAVLNRHLVIDRGGRVERYHFWSTYYEPGDLEPLAAAAGFASLRCFPGFLPGAGPFDGDRVSFCVAEKG